MTPITILVFLNILFSAIVSIQFALWHYDIYTHRYIQRSEKAFYASIRVLVLCMMLPVIFIVAPLKQAVMSSILICIGNNFMFWLCFDILFNLSNKKEWYYVGTESNSDDFLQEMSPMGILTVKGIPILLSYLSVLLIDSLPKF